MINDLVQIDKEACRDLWNMGFVNQALTSQQPLIVFPLCQSKTQVGQRRVSEQEARFTFASALQNAQVVSQRYRYSVETPTFGNYCFLNRQQISWSPPLNGIGTSAMVDLTLYSASGLYLQTACHVEFKTGLNAFSITKDIVKLVVEQQIWEEPNALYAHWFQLIDKADAMTFKCLFSRLSSAFAECCLNSITAPVRILFTVCVLDDIYAPRLGVYKEFIHPGGSVPLRDSASQFFNWGNGPTGRRRNEVKDHLQSLQWGMI